MMLDHTIRRLMSCWIGGVLLAGTVSSQSTAVVLVYEGFEYPSGDLNGLNGGEGWSGAWTSGAGQSTILPDGLAYQDANGNQLQVTGGRVFSTGVSGNANPFRDVVPADGSGDNPIGWQPGTTWWSGIAQRLQPHVSLDDNVIRASGVQIHDAVGPSTPAERLSVGKGTTGPGGGVAEIRYNWGMLYDGSVANQIDTGVPITDPAFFVVRIDHLGTTNGAAANDNAYLWINPNLDEEPLIGTHDAEFIGLSEFSISRAAVFVGNTNAAGSPYAEFTWDEFRLGTSFEDVAPFAPAPGGDYNDNGVVDAADYTTWRDHLGQPAGTLPNDTDGGVIGQAQYLTWKANFGLVTSRPSTVFTVEIDTATGEGTLINNRMESFNIDYYALYSDLDNLDPDWSGIDGQTTPGQGWDPAGGSNESQLIELFLPEGGFTIPALGELPLGVVLDPLGGDVGAVENYRLEVGLASGAFISGGVRLDSGGSGAADSLSVAVPEPMSLVSLLVGALATLPWSGAARRR